MATLPILVVFRCMSLLLSEYLSHLKHPEPEIYESGVFALFLAAARFWWLFQTSDFNDRRERNQRASFWLENSSNFGSLSRNCCCLNAILEIMVSAAFESPTQNAPKVSWFGLLRHRAMQLSSINTFMRGIFPFGSAQNKGQVQCHKTEFLSMKLSAHCLPKVWV